MIKIIEEITELEKELKELGIEFDLNEITKITLPFIDAYEKFTLINLPSYTNGESQNMLIITRENTLLFSTAKKTIKIEKKFEKIAKKKHGESTVAIYLILKSILKNYSTEFIRIREVMNRLDLDPILDTIEEIGRDLRRLTDRIECLYEIVIELKEKEIEVFEPKLIESEYELFTTETKYWLERCRSHVYRIASLRTKSEMRSNRELNDTMKKLTMIMTFLTIASIVVNVPGTIGAIFGIPALSNAYFENHTTFLLITLISTTTLSIVLGWSYWKYLGLK